MSERRFKFVSPGIFVQEIDQSRRPRTPEKRGPLVIGRFERGPTMRPFRVNSFSEFLRLFGAPSAGSAGGDTWRNGNKTAPLYAAYAAQAYLRNNGPINVLRLVGTPHDDANATGQAGWSGSAYAAGTGGGAYGLFVCTSGSITPTGSLAAIFYANTTTHRFALSGNVVGTAVPTASMGVLIDSLNTTPDFKMHVHNDATATADEVITFNFDRDSDKFIRKVFNTNPTLAGANAAIGVSSSFQKKYWLGETFEQYVTNNVPASVQQSAFVLPLKQGNFSGDDFRTTTGAQPGKSGWVIAQDTGLATSYNPRGAQKLFRAVGLDAGQWHQDNLKISIANILPSRNQFMSHGTFSLIVRDIRDTDSSIQVVERFDNLTLDPASPNFIGERIGTKYYQFNDSDGRLREYGKFINKSSYIRIVLCDELESGIGLPAELLPAGFFGPTRYKDFAVISGSTTVSQFGLPAISAAGGAIIATSGLLASSFVGSGSVAVGHAVREVVTSPEQTLLVATVVNGVSTVREVGIRIPSASYRSNSVDSSLSNKTNAYWGLSTTRTNSSRAFDFSLRDILREKASVAGGASSWDEGTYTSQDIFTLDDLSGSNAGDQAYHLTYVSGSRAANSSATAIGVYKADTTTALLSSGFSELCKAGWNKFTMPLYGGSDGLDITLREPLANAAMGATSTAINNPVYNTYDRAIAIASEKELIDFNLAVIPGLTKAALTAKLINTCEERGDAMAIIDLEGGYIPLHERLGGTSEAANIGSVKSTIDTLKSRGINSSYGCAYYPWVLARDTASTGQAVWMPPSVIALGVMGSSETRSELWFAPAGFNRGGLSEEAAGIPVVDVRQRLNAADRDDLYKNNINPIASFPSEGIVVFGQKTLQVTPSALDRINVRRLMIFLKKEISIAAAEILFDQNVQETWKRFIGKVRPLLKQVQARFGITDFKLILDETTTTAELIDRNVLYAKVFVKPARAIEYIAIDFFISSTGASFEE
tara:strand:- start:5192 stop:8164 length:2973 start_codon:yes stop_codon:yes gene_type:complete